MPSPQPDAPEVERAREWLRANPWDAMRTTDAGKTECLARYGAERYAEGIQAGREDAGKIVADLNVGIATTPEGEAWNSAIRKAVAAIHAGATP